MLLSLKTVKITPPIDIWEVVPAGTLLRGLKYLDELRRELEEKHGANTETDTTETYLLKGPTLRIEESKMSSR